MIVVIGAACDALSGITLMRVQSRPVATTLWLAVVAVLLSVIVLQLTGHASVLPTEAKQTPRPAPSLPDFAPLEISLLTSPQIIDDIVARPLFSESRRPSKQARTKRSAHAVAVSASLTLIGILSHGPLEIALIRHSEHGLLRVQPGQTIDAWRVDTVAPDRVHLSDDDAKLWLKVGATSPPAN
jgi:hypothetical protein